MAASPVRGKYEQLLDRQSAYEMLKEKAQGAAKEAEEAEAAAEAKAAAEREFNAGRRYSGSRVGRSTAKEDKSWGGSFGEALGSAVLKEMKGTTGRRIVRGILGGLFKGR
jgi:hypothetical protein